ncbi:MAG: hypothetical protein HKN91_17905 [Acidimicrobiia bacterium]|nr:hypothetical protein [Acidimicrobiia bacterium]
MTYDIDATLAEIRELGEQISALPAGPEREELEGKRDGLRAHARFAADAARPLSHLRAELHNVEEQLEGLNAELIKPAMNEHYKMITDPSAYRRRINDRIEELDADRRAGLEQRRSELAAAIDVAQAD